MKFNNETIREAVNEWCEEQASALKKYGHIKDWDTSEVTDMSKLFLDKHEFNSPIGNWDVSNVTTMHDMFDNAYRFNQNINNWDVSNVEDMSEMFSSSEDFNQPIGNWNVSNVTDMNWMFYEATAFNQPIGNWNVSNVTGMEGMFLGAKSFNQPIGNWNVSNVTDRGCMFLGAKSFNQPIGNWNVGNVSNMENMFVEATSFNQPIGNIKKTEKSYYDNGNIQEEWEVNENGERHGKSKLYHENGQLQVEVNFTNGLQDNGQVISYHDNGIKARKVTLVNHLMNGPYYEWHRNGQLKTEGIYNDKVPKVLKEWDENGVLIIAEWTNTEKEEYLNNSRKVNTKLLYDLREEYFKLDDNENYTEALKKLNKIIEQIPVLKGQSLISYVDPSDMLNGILLEEIYFNRSQLYRKLNLIEEAKNDLIKAIKSNPNRKEPLFHHSLGCTMLQCGDFTSCIEHFNLALEIDPEYYNSYYMRAVAYCSDKSELTDVNQAIDDLKKYLVYDPNDNAAVNLLNILQKKRGI